MNQVRLGRSDLLVSPIAFGAWELGGDWGATDEQGAIATIRQAADSGLNFAGALHRIDEIIAAEVAVGGPRIGLKEVTT